MIDPGLADRVALVTGANNPQGVGAAIARALAAQGTRVCLHYLRRSIAPSRSGDPTVPGEAMYLAQQARSGEELAAELRAAGGRAVAWEGDLADPATIPALFDAAEAALGPVEILVNNAAHSVGDTFVPDGQAGRTVSDFPMAAITAASHDAHFAINSRAVALAMAELARRHARRGLGPDRQRQHRRRLRLPDRGLVRREQARARELQPRGRERARPLRYHGQRRLARADPDRLHRARAGAGRRGQHAARAGRSARGRRRRGRVPRLGAGALADGAARVRWGRARDAALKGEQA